MPHPSGKFTLVADTNILFPRDPRQLVSSKFMAAWAECQKLAEVHLVIPEIVRNERLYQLTCTVQRSLEHAQKNFETISGAIGCDTQTLPQISDLKEQIKKRFDNWAKQNHIQIAPVPYASIDWPRVVNDAVWRNSPFSPAGEDEDSEKGFRDCLVAETLGHLLAEAKSHRIVFLSGDRLLRECTISRFASKVFAAYENMDALHTYLELTKQQAEKSKNELIQKIIQKAPSVFYSPGAECLYTKFYIGNQIIQRFSAQLTDIARPEFGNERDLIPVSEEKIFIDSTHFDQATSKGSRWGWRTRLRFVRVFREKNAEVEGLAKESKNAWDILFRGLSLDEIVRIAPFDIFWTAKCDASANFSELHLVEISPQPHAQEIGFQKYKHGFHPKKAD